MKAYLVHNADNFSVGQRDDEWTGQDGARVAMIAWDSWENNGWQCEQIYLPPATDYFAPIHPLASGPFNSFIPYWVENGLSGVWFTFDVVNHRFTPERFKVLQAHYGQPSTMLFCGTGCWSLSCGYMNETGASVLNNLIREGDYPPTPAAGWLSDEALLRWREPATPVLLRIPRPPLCSPYRPGLPAAMTHYARTCALYHPALAKTREKNHIKL